MWKYKYKQRTQEEKGSTKGWRRRKECLPFPKIQLGKKIEYEKKISGGGIKSNGEAQ